MGVVVKVGMIIICMSFGSPVNNTASHIETSFNPQETKNEVNFVHDQLDILAKNTLCVLVETSCLPIIFAGSASGCQLIIRWVDKTPIAAWVGCHHPHHCHWMLCSLVRKLMNSLITYKKLWKLGKMV